MITRAKECIHQNVPFVLASIQAFFLMKISQKYLFTFNKLWGDSMKPVFLQSDNGIIIADLLSPKIRGFRKNDIVLFNNPFDSSTYICKRVILTQGQTNETYAWQIFVPKSHVWLEGDNKLNSHDSRHFGPLSTGLGIGIVRAQIWPINKFKLFL